MTHLQEEISDLFVEAQAVEPAGREAYLLRELYVMYNCERCGSFMHDTTHHPSKEERAATQKRWEARVYIERRKYKTAWEAERKLAEITEKLRLGERPKRWGRVWKQAAKTLGISIEKAHT